MTGDHRTPADRDRSLVTGVYDTHGHVAPEVMERRIAGWRGAPLTSDSASHVSVWRTP